MSPIIVWAVVLVIAVAAAGLLWPRKKRVLFAERRAMLEELAARRGWQLAVRPTRGVAHRLTGDGFVIEEILELDSSYDRTAWFCGPKEDEAIAAVVAEEFAEMLKSTGTRVVAQTFKWLGKDMTLPMLVGHGKPTLIGDGPYSVYTMDAALGEHLAPALKATLDGWGTKIPLALQIGARARRAAAWSTSMTAEELEKLAAVGEVVRALDLGVRV